MLPPDGWADVATKRDLHELEARVDAKLTRLEARLIRANIASMIGLAGLVLAAGAVV